MRIVFLIPVGAFVLISGWFNYLFSSTLGDDTTQWAWIVIGCAAAIYAALGLDLIRQAWKRRSPAKAFAAFLLWLPSMAYDGVAAYGFATREQAAAATRYEKAGEPLAKARGAVARAQDALRPYEGALDETAAAGAVAALERQTNDARCRLARLADAEREICTNLTKARLVLSQAEAKARLTAVLLTAESDLAHAPVPPPPDKRADVFGQEVIAWLPVVLLQLGTLLGVFAAALPPKPVPTKKESPVPPAKNPPLKAALPVIAGREASIVEILAALSRAGAQLPNGIRIDGEGWIRGGQRRFAAAAGVPLTRFNRDAKTAWRKGLVEMKTEGNETALRLGSMGNA